MIAEEIDNIQFHNIFISESNKNNNNFIKIFYSNNIVFLNSIYIRLHLTNLKISNNKINFEHLYNSDKIKNIEHYILNNINIYKKPVYKLASILDNKNLKYSNEIKNYYILKISGIWETQDSYGITFKILEYNNIFNLC
jgi:hypothetical protein